MTNADIIFTQSQELMKQGVIEGTGRTFKATITNAQGEQEEVVVEEAEPIHTYAGWKERGYQVQKGEKAIAKFTIWKHVVKKAKQEGDEDETKMFMKTASWFKFSQVAPIEQ